ncbi:MAG: 4'-phosphopantetheinyl transferase superfamily protein [Chitinophagales bacterium]
MKIFFIHHPDQLPAKTFNTYLQQLPIPIQQKIRRYRRWKDQQAGLWGKLLLAKALKEFGYDKKLLSHLQYTTYQRPYFPENMEIKMDFNITHSGFVVACVVSEKQRIGIDVEHIRPIEIHHFTKQFSTIEIQQMYGAQNTERAFFERWCQKEAIIKVDGRGLSIPLPQVLIEGLTAKVEDQIFYLQPLQLVDDYASYLASTEPIEGFEVQEMTIEALLF